MNFTGAKHTLWKDRWIRFTQTFSVALLVGIFAAQASAQYHPHHSFMPNGSWQFRNFSTARMSGDTFQEAFDLKWYDYLNPITPIMYLAGRDMADGGNCFGMCALAAAGERTSGTLGTAFSGSLREDFWSNYRTRNSNLDLDINTYHWRQLSSEFVTRWLGGIADSAPRCAEKAREDIEAGRYGILCINMDGMGHALIPLQVGGTSENIDIVVYDPNLPLDETHASTLVINRRTEQWRYNLAWSTADGWNRTWTGGRTGISYVTYTGSSGWKDLLNSPLDLVFGNNTAVEQITDQSGRRLYKRSPPRGPEDIDFSERGLGQEVVPWYPIMQKGKSPAATSAQRKSDPLSMKIQSAMHRRYEADYGRDSQIYFVRNPKLTLHIDVAAGRRSKELRMAMGDRSGTVEVAFAPEKISGPLKARTTIPVAQPNRLTLTTSGNTPLRASVRLASVVRGQQVNFESVADVPVRKGASTTVMRSGPGKIALRAPGLKPTQVQREQIGQDARVRSLAPVAAQLGPQPEPPENKVRSGVKKK